MFVVKKGDVLEVRDLARSDHEPIHVTLTDEKPET